MDAAIGKLPPYLRYVGVSGAALGIDMVVFLALITGGMAAVLASGIGYSVGIVIHWILSSRIVFAAHTAISGTERIKQKGLFVISALLGLGLTMAIVGAGSAAGIDPRLAKIIAIAVSFNVTYLMRKLVVFA